jgi:ATP-dependent Clp protease adapter protein ClpS
MSQENKGYFRPIPVFGVPVFFHRTLPLYALVLLLASGLNVAVALAGFASFMLILAAHEFGHIAAVRIFGLRVHALYLAFGGGRCVMEHAEKVRHSAIIYGAGMLAQLALLLPAAIYWLANGMPQSATGRIVLLTFTLVNFIILMLCLVPRRLASGRATDGMVLWQLYRHACHQAPHPLPKPVPHPVGTVPECAPHASLLSVPALVPPGFVTGIEIFNDDATPMEFVVALLRRHLGLDEGAALAVMLDIHHNGGVLFPVETLARAQQLAAAMVADARRQGHELLCRAVDATHPGGA